MGTSEANGFRVTVDDLRRAVDADVRRNWSDWQWMRWLEASAMLRGQSFRNVVLIKLQLPDAVWVEGRQGWQRRGRRVVRGASGIRIVAPAADFDRHAGPVQGHGVATVWDVSQTDGAQIVRSSLGPVVSVRPMSVFAGLAQVAAAAGYRVEQGSLSADMRGGGTDHRRRRIVVPGEFDDPVVALSLAHELAHLRMHKLSRDSGCHGLVRLEAASVAYTLLARFGVVPGGVSTDLIPSVSGMVGRSPAARLVETLGGRVVAVAGRLIDAAERHIPTSEMRLDRAGSKSIDLDAETRQPDLGL
ncbi:hypothetical protein JOF29_003714 [Kribbella aluminosa]|uniref:Uncharacterized protein n=1 Tax=Kribbella aluminosa TaxID=416017 RepID=A0ABS4UM17_9ACTN|nr:hypothetical protein [Kribbella aluminosa]MBP2352631.1 hypothetical protein [Kribbella aluminosa]